MHSCTYVIIGPEGDIDTETQQALAPFDQNLEVEPYKMRLDRGDLRLMAEFYRIPGDEWLTKVRTVLKAFPGHRVVGVD